MHTPQLGQLANGLRYVLIDRPGFAMAHVSVYIRAGSCYEGAGVHGGSHLLEHMLFRGNARRANQHALDDYYDRVGADTNACTTRTCTMLMASVVPEAVATVCDEFVEALTTPTFDKFEEERAVVYQEAAAMVGDQGESLDPSERLVKLAFGSKIGAPIAGLPSEIERLTVAKLRRLHLKHYGASNMALAIAGDFNKIGSAVGLCVPFVDRIPAGVGLPEVKPSLVQTRPRVEARKDRVPSPTVLLGFKVPGPHEPMGPALMLLSMVLSSGPMSRLWKRVRGDVGLAYNATSYLHGVTESASLFGISADAEAERLPRVMHEIFDELVQLAKEAIPEAELDRVKARFLRHAVATEDSLAELCDFYGPPLLSGRMCSYAAEFAEVQKVTPSVLQRTVLSFLHPAKLNMVIAGVDRAVDRKRIIREAAHYADQFGVSL